ncbi:hypothetical protein [Planctopirus limnophila]|nr:hypothetical protein [Planctopirus limnophila]
MDAEPPIASFLKSMLIGGGPVNATVMRKKMSSLADFKELVDHICKRHRMYVCDGTFYEVAAYIQGFAAAMTESPFGGENRFAFNEYVTLACGFPAKLAWPFVLKKATQTDEDAIAKLHTLLTAYIEAVDGNRVAQLLSTERMNGSVRDAEPQVICWRLFSRALHRGDQIEIEKHALQRDDIQILWSSSYPADLIPKMDEIAESYSIPVLFVSDDGMLSRVMTPDFGEIELEMLDGSWKIDPSPIIRQRIYANTKT